MKPSGSSITALSVAESFAEALKTLYRFFLIRWIRGSGMRTEKKSSCLLEKKPYKNIEHVPILDIGLTSTADLGFKW